MTETRLELIGEIEHGDIGHLNCTAGENVVGVSLDFGIGSCLGCWLEVPAEVCDSFVVMEDGLERPDKPYFYGGYDPPLWQFDGTEWRMS